MPSVKDGRLSADGLRIEGTLTFFYHSPCQPLPNRAPGYPMQYVGNDTLRCQHCGGEERYSGRVSEIRSWYDRSR